MSEASDAYAEAERLIGRSFANDTQSLDLDIPKTRALARLPPRISILTGLTFLNLSRSQVFDLHPLTPLVELTFLDLSNTQASDLRPLRTLTKLVTNPKYSGLSFENTPFARLPEFVEIAAIKDPATRAQQLFERLKDWVPDSEVTVAESAKTGLRYTIGPAGVLGYARLPSPSDPSDQQRQLHALLVEDTADLVLSIGGNNTAPHPLIAQKLNRYAAALGTNLSDMSAVVIWKVGNDIRLILRADADKKRQYVNEPTLGPDNIAALQGLTATHNALCALNPDLTALDHAQIDPAERHKAEQDRALLQAAIDAFALQTRLILSEVTEDLRDLHLQAGGTNDAALRAIQIERDSIENLLKEIIAQGIIEARSDTFASRVSGDVRAAVVGAAVTGAGTLVGPDAAASFAQMVQTLQPQIAALMTALHGQGSSLAHSADWVTAKLRQALQK